MLFRSEKTARSVWTPMAVPGSDDAGDRYRGSGLRYYSNGSGHFTGITNWYVPF